MNGDEMPDALDLRTYLVRYTRSLLSQTAQSIRDLTPDELHFRPGEHCNSIGFDAWHVARTADNLVHFAFERQQPVWLQQGFDQRWSLPKVDQGTGMAPATAYALRFPAAAELAGYIEAVRDAIVPRIEGMSDEYLATKTTIRPNGELARADIIGQVIINHGNNHLGQINLALTLAGKPGLGI